MKTNYHGIIINLSQKDNSVTKKLTTLGKNIIIPGLLVLQKVEVNEDVIDRIIEELQNNLREKLFPIFKAFYFHFYRNDELIVCYKNKKFKVSTNPDTWNDVIAYGLGLGIPKQQLDFSPCKFEEETY